VSARERNSEYSEKLKDPRWQRMRLEILQRDDWRCCICGDKTRTLHVHHMVYFWGRDPWDYSPSLLRTLCEVCHERETDLRREAMDLLHEALGIGGFYSGDIWQLALFVQTFSDGILSPSGFINALKFFKSRRTSLLSQVEYNCDLYGPWWDGAEPRIVWVDKQTGRVIEHPEYPLMGLAKQDQEGV